MKSAITKERFIRDSLISLAILIIIVLIFSRISFNTISDDINYYAGKCKQWIYANPVIFELESIDTTTLNLKLGRISKYNNDNTSVGNFDFKLPTGEFNIQFSEKNIFLVEKIKKYLKKSTFVVKDITIWSYD